MSRCFPFQPERYVKKAKAEDIDSLKRENEREKKQKKDRQDKEKQESKEKREKDKSEGKHRDKKEKKEKHRDKKRDRDKDKEKKRNRKKDRGGTSEERSHSEQQTDRINSNEKIFYKGRPPEKIPEASGEIDKEKNRTHVPDARRVGGQSANHGAAAKVIDKNRNIQNAIHIPVDSKFVTELGNRVRDGGGAAVQSSEKVAVNGQKKVEGMVGLINASSSPLADMTERSHEWSDNCRLSGQGLKDRKEIRGTVGQNFSISIQMSEGMPRPPKTSVEEKMAGMEKIREKDSKHMGWDKHIVLDLQSIKTSGKDKDLDREKKKDERTKKAENRVPEQEKQRERVKDSLDAADANKVVQHVIQEVNKIVPSTLNDKKRKTLKPNGFLHENETRQIKLPRMFSSLSHPASLENGRILDAPQCTNQHLLLDRQGQSDVIRADKAKEHKLNGIPEKKPNLVPSTLDEASLELLVQKAMSRSPHPDLKYLDKVLTVSKFEDLVLPEEDEEWLSGSRHELQKPKGTHSSDEMKDTTPLVWSESMPLDSADIIALPYVVPF